MSKDNKNHKQSQSLFLQSIGLFGKVIGAMVYTPLGWIRAIDQKDNAHNTCSCGAKNSVNSANCRKCKKDMMPKY